MLEQTTSARRGGVDSRRAMPGKGIVLFLLIALVFTVPTRTYAVPVTLELALLLDVSGSIDEEEYGKQRLAYSNAFLDPSIHALIAALPNGLAVTYVEWSGENEQSQLVGWTHLTDAASSSSFASAINATTRAFAGGATAPGDALQFGADLFENNGFEGERRVIDISGDGVENVGIDTATVAAALMAAGIQINGLAVLGEAGVQDFYQNAIVTPGGGFLIVATGFDDIEVALNRKLQHEIPGTNPVPEPAGILLSLSGLGVLAALRYRGE